LHVVQIKFHMRRGSPHSAFIAGHFVLFGCFDTRSAIFAECGLPLFFFNICATLLEKCSKYDRRSKNFKKIRLRRAVQYIIYSCLGKFGPPRRIKKFVLHCWKSAPNTTKDQKFSKISPAAGSSVYGYLGKFVPRGKLKNLCCIHC
jgi:hypothetical protein